MNNIYAKYFDYAATTPCDERVLQTMAPYWNEHFGNASSRSHKYGWNAEEAIEIARTQVANLINAKQDEIIFTSGATESNNLAIKGFVLGPNMEPTKQKKILALSTEHKCVIESVRYLKQLGYNIKFLPVLSTGLVDLNLLEQELESAAFLSISYVNNETGVIQDIPTISKMCRAKNVCLHVDAAQAFGKININARDVDLLSISGHKIYGPKGIGALFVSKTPRIRLSHLISGGGQERGMRSGTLATPLCVGLGAAANLAQQNMEADYNQAKYFESQIIQNVIEKTSNLNINGIKTQKIPHILNISVPYVEGESLLMRLHEFALASGSACTSKSLEPSHVISSMNPEEKDLAHSSIRICFGRYSTQNDVDELIVALNKHIYELRELSPLWSMVQKGIDLKTIKWA